MGVDSGIVGVSVRNRGIRKIYPEFRYAKEAGPACKDLSPRTRDAVPLAPFLRGGSVGRLYMLRRYCPPTSNNAVVICPREHTRTASISTANTLPFSITV